VTITPVDSLETLRRILTDTDALLLDFDGPICAVFAGFPATMVAGQLREVLVESGQADLPEDVRMAVDPFTVLFHAATLGETKGRYVEAAFRALEADAIRTARPTAGGHELIRSFQNNGRSVAIVSNNSAYAVAAYLDLHGLRASVDFIAAREDSFVHRLKPRPFLVNEAINALCKPTRCTLVGDSVTDIQAAHAARIRSIGYANRSDKIAELSNMRPAAITTSMMLLSSASST
jgi:phosphoglycolate phosphatase